jgi:hypothetical protein
LSVKLIMTWDIAPEHEQEYFEFVVREFIPGVQRMGFELSDAWATVFGNQPQMQVGALLNNSSRLRQILNSSEWKDLNHKLMDFVQNYNQKVVEARGGFQF